MAAESLRHTVIGVVAFAVLCLPTTVNAQEEPLRRGFWLSSGFGGGFAIADQYGDGTSLAYYLRLGGTPSEKFTVGGEMLVFIESAAFGELSTRAYGVQGGSAFMLTGLYYPMARKGWFLKGGLGYGVAGSESLSISLDASTGIDVRLGGNFSLTPAIDVLLIASEDRTVAHLLFTVGATWH